MRLSFILMTVFALALPISAQAGGKGSGGSKTTTGSTTGGSGTGKASPAFFQHAASGKHISKATITVR
jgi:type VI protein secretion system component Hcp